MDQAMAAWASHGKTPDEQVLQQRTPAGLGKEPAALWMLHPAFFKLSGSSLCQGEDTAMGRA